MASRRRRGGGGGGERRRRRSGGRFGASSGRGAAPAREGARGRVVLVGERAEVGLDGGLGAAVGHGDGGRCSGGSGKEEAAGMSRGAPVGQGKPF